MAGRTGQSRLQHGLFATPLEELIGEDNLVRVVDAFVDALDLSKLGFKGAQENKLGAASYEASDLLKIYFYGYLNRIRSSRMLERECHRNVELMWLVNRHTPSCHTISTFRTLKEVDKDGKVLFNHRKALVEVFRTFNRFCDKLGLFGKQTLAVDGTKIAAQNSKKKHLSEDKIARKLERVENRIEEYMDELDMADISDDASMSPTSKAVLLAIGELDERRTELLEQKERLRKAKETDPHLTQICLTDADARMLPINNEGMMQIAYNVQSVVDDKHCLIADFSTENQKDLYLLAPMAKSAKEELGIEGNVELLADKGYHSGKGLQECADNDVTTYVAFPERTHRDRPKGFQKEDFKYDHDKNAYICPANNELKTSGTWHAKTGRQGHVQARYQLFRSPFTVCSNCPFREDCLSKSSIEQRQGRTIERSEFEEAALANKKRILLHRDKYKRRQAIVEHPFGTIKRHWGFHFTLLKSMEKVNGEMALVFSAHNLRRVVSILGAKGLRELLNGLFRPKTTPSGRPCRRKTFDARFVRPNFRLAQNPNHSFALAA